MAFQDTTVKPAIKIFTAKAAVPVQILKEAVSGVEEESIPYEVDSRDETDAIELAHMAANQSPLEVGIGIADKVVAVHYRKLPKDKPLFLVKNSVEEGTIRSICSNAARLVKGTPFNISPEL